VCHSVAGQPIPQTRRLRTLLTLASVVLVATVAASCGGDSGGDNAADSTPSTSETTTDETPEAGGLAVTDGITPDDLAGCLTDAGLDAAATDSVPFGVEVPVVEVDVTGMTDYEGGTRQGAQLFVFADSATAADNANVLTLGGSDDPTNNRYGVHVNVVRVMSIILAPDPHTDDEAALLGCLPS
jgi:hypothetical protein